MNSHCVGRKEKMKIAIIGSGISGLTCGYLLSNEHEVHVFEAEDYIGGHTHTVPVKTDSGNYRVDTGFIVFNDWTYPHFIKLMDQIGVASKTSSMSFSVKAEASGLEYNGTNINSLFAQRLNFFRPKFHRMIKDILRFNREAPSVLEKNSPDQDLTLKEYLIKYSYSIQFKENYIVPMGAAIWSSSAEQMDDFPIEFFVRFFKNHGMLSVENRPVWRVIEGGSSSYIEPLIKNFKERIRLKTKVLSVKRVEKQVVLEFEQNAEMKSESFDEVIFASHADQTLAMLKDTSPLEKEIIGAFAYQPNETLLHTDESVLPRKKLAWAAWNYFVPKVSKKKVAVTYDMNILQGIISKETFNVSLNMEDQIDAKKVIKKLVYHHPVYQKGAFKAQGRWSEISGKNKTHFCGAYWGYGFHEDGVKSAIRVCEMLGVKW